MTEDYPTPAGPPEPPPELVHSMTDMHALVLQMADELDRLEQMQQDDRSAAHPLALSARAALAQPAPPAEGDVAELVADLRSTAAGLESQAYPQTAAQITRAADMLERQQPVPVPVPVSEFTRATLARATLARWGNSTPSENV